MKGAFLGGFLFQNSFYVNMSIASLWYNIGDETPYLPAKKGVKIGKKTGKW